LLFVAANVLYIHSEYALFIRKSLFKKAFCAFVLAVSITKTFSMLHVRGSSSHVRSNGDPWIWANSLFYLRNWQITC